MPYLHWDAEDAMKARTDYLAKRSSGAAPFRDSVSPDMPEINVKSEREKLLMDQYLLSEHNSDSKTRHVLHIRRTLDQSLYHNLKDTVFRDADQTVHRYQKELNEKKPKKQQPLSVIMVDQLWMWILVGKSGKAEAIITCFPSRDWFDVGIDVGITNDGQIPTDRILDRRRTTDVFQITKSYIQHRPNAVNTPYDLAGVIASRCSRALLDHSTDMLNFAEVYENSISYIVCHTHSMITPII